MRIGLALDLGRHDGRLDHLIDSYAALLDRVDGFAFHSIWFGEAYVATGDRTGHVPSPMLGIAALASATSAELGLGVTLLPAWHPLRLAYDAAVLDGITGGRLIVGTGVGREPLWRSFGLEPEGVGGWVDDALRALRALWTGANGFEGEVVKVDTGIEPLPVRKGGPPFWIGGKSAAAIRRAATVGEAYFAGSSTLESELAGLIHRYREALGDPEGGHVALNRIAVVAEDAGQAGQIADTHLGAWFSSYRDRGLISGDFEDALEEMMVIGTTDQVSERIARYGELGVDQMNLRVAPIGLPFEVAERTIALLCDSGIVGTRSA